MTDWNQMIAKVGEHSRSQAAEIRRAGTTAGIDQRGNPLVLLTTTGARSGQRRENPVIRVEQDGVYVAVASLGGAPRDPDWYHNVVAHPRISLMDGSVEDEYVAEEVFGEERAHWWAVAVETFPDYADYQRRCDRTIPVLVLRRG